MHKHVPVYHVSNKKINLNLPPPLSQKMQLFAGCLAILITKNFQIVY